MPPRFTLIPEVYLLLLKGKNIFMLRRFQTGYEDGKYGLIAGHVDGNETAMAAILREAKEEAGITLHQNDLQLVHVMHRMSADRSHERMGLFFATQKWQGDPRNTEPHKCDDMRWVPINALPSNTITYIRQAIAHYRKQVPYSENGWDQPSIEGGKPIPTFRIASRNPAGTGAITSCSR